MGSRILIESASKKSKISVCCAFLVLASVASVACPYATAAGMQTYGLYSGDGGIIQDNAYIWDQSSDDIGFLSPGNENLRGIVKNGMVAVGMSGSKTNSTIDANDHQIYKGDVTNEYHGGGVTWDTSYLRGQRMPMAPTSYEETVAGTNETYNVTPGSDVNNTTVFMRPYDETLEVSKSTIGNKGVYMSDKMIEQGSNETTDYIIHNAVAMGNGAFTNDVHTISKVGFIGVSNSTNYAEESSQHEVVGGQYNATSSTTIESYVDAFLNPEFSEPAIKSEFME